MDPEELRESQLALARLKKGDFSVFLDPVPPREPS